MKPDRRSLWLLGTGLSFAGVLLSGCGQESSNASQSQSLSMTPIEALPFAVRRAAVPVRQAYQFAVANPGILSQVPCYCGCGAVGHTSNAACYFSQATSTDPPVFDSHALGCSICVDITQDVMRYVQQGKSLTEIRSDIDATYARYGPSNLP